MSRTGPAPGTPRTETATHHTTRTLTAAWMNASSQMGTASAAHHRLRPAGPDVTLQPARPDVMGTASVAHHGPQPALPDVMRTASATHHRPQPTLPDVMRTASVAHHVMRTASAAHHVMRTASAAQHEMGTTSAARLGMGTASAAHPSRLPTLGDGTGATTMAHHGMRTATG